MAQKAVWSALASPLGDPYVGGLVFAKGIPLQVLVKIVARTRK